VKLEEDIAWQQIVLSLQLSGCENRDFADFDLSVDLAEPFSRAEDSASGKKASGWAVPNSALSASCCFVLMIAQLVRLNELEPIR